jgi:UDP-N-acetylmuramate dehydrogenase
MTTLEMHNCIDELHNIFGDRLQKDVKLSRFSTARVGGCADFLLVVNSAAELEQAIGLAWRFDIPYHLLGSASNILVSEKGIRGLVIINHARAIKVDLHSDPPTLWAESGALMSTIAQRAGAMSLSGLEWATSLPGTLGGALYGNAGAFGGEISHSLVLAEILHVENGRQNWICQQFDYLYRSSTLKRKPGQRVVILSAELKLQRGEYQQIQECMQRIQSRRRDRQPPGACTGSMFKNPPGDFAGRLIESSGLKGSKIGGVEISPRHGNFFINHGSSTADDFMALIELTRKTVFEQHGIDLELEVELIGDWNHLENNAVHNG